jgi:hypothetical protein
MAVLFFEKGYLLLSEGPGDAERPSRVAGENVKAQPLGARGRRVHLLHSRPCALVCLRGLRGDPQGAGGEVAWRRWLGPLWRGAW